MGNYFSRNKELVINPYVGSGRGDEFREIRTNAAVLSIQAWEDTMPGGHCGVKALEVQWSDGHTVSHGKALDVVFMVPAVNLSTLRN
ncbi:predicted protein [Uncinocarpus reesii 1704]|uniref:Uncharacterized protein n=1 Tax=Uncinocarpus reesii (strain UAMH 1704) TaxID=336963 RepID=C4JZ87_UNCRE|nr:uncharacterized protein UREG_07488 [Uncinocarpus reesii 1704]EEP82623.1 predicted protein [Uncinocarpus reesii 1704]